MIAFLAVSLPGAAARHWTETEHETLWSGRYSNCDKGYAVDLPPNVVGHGTHSPAPNHGIVISAAKPQSTSIVSLDDERLIDVYDEYDARELGSPRTWLEEELERSKPTNRPDVREIRFRGLPAVHVRYQSERQSSRETTDEVIVFRKDPTPIFYVLMLRTPIQHYREDRSLYEHVRDGFQIRAVPKGECSND